MAAEDNNWERSKGLIVNSAGVDPRKKKTFSQDKEHNLIDWITFYRRNIHRFIQHYLGIKLHFFQILMVYLIHIFPYAVIVCSRAISKSFTVSVYGCATCILYPNSKILVTAMTRFLVYYIEIYSV